MAEEAQILGTGNFRYEAKKKEDSDQFEPASTKTDKRVESLDQKAEVRLQGVEEESKSEGRRVTIVDE